MLLSKTEQLINELNNFKTLQESSNESQDYIRKNNDLKTIVIHVEKLSEIVSLFRKHGFSIEIKSIISYPLELFKTLYKNWEDDKKSIIQRNDFFRRVNWNTIESEIESILLKQWEDYIDSNKPNINRETLDVFEQIPDFSGVVKSLKEKLELLDEYKKSLPISDNNFKLVISSSSEMKLLIEQLDSKDIPASVSNFLKKAGTIAGIDLSEITTEIFEWLKENNLLNKCLVKFK
ncbi:MAG: transcriptional/translational regulatory protein YebC/TACO1 [Sulfurimonas sp.]|jgi:transcriptional/translational regulatory protein YebC/TACO1